MTGGDYLLCHVSQFQTIINNHNEQWKSVFQKSNNFYVKKNHNVMLDFNRWMVINDISMTLWVQL